MLKIDKIVIATRNPAKKARFEKLLVKVAGQVLSPDDLGVTGKPSETGETAEVNAAIKAKFYARATGLPVLSEDESLFVDFLPPDKQPGVHVRRINGQDEVNDAKLLSYWEKLVAQAPPDKRFGHWHITYSLAVPNRAVNTVSLNAPIRFFSPSSKIKKPGWPMSSLQGPARFNKPETELTPREEQLLRKTSNDLILAKIDELLKTRAT